LTLRTPIGAARTRTVPGEEPLQRTISSTIVLTVLAVVSAALLSWFSYRAVRTALENEFARRIENVSAAIASQVSPDDIADVQLFGEDGAGYANILVLLEELRATTRVVNASVIDTARRSVYDGRGPEFLLEQSRMDSLAHPLLTQALAGKFAISDVYPFDGTVLRAAFAPIKDGNHVVGVVAVEGLVDYLPTLSGFRRTLLLATLIIAITIMTLAALFVRQTWSAAQLERRLSRAENLAAMGRLTATLAHEIKNPLAIIRGSALRLGRLEPEAQRMSEFVVEETDRLSKTVGRYLQFAKGAESAFEGGTLLARASGDMRATLDQTLDLLEGELRSRKVTFAREGQWPEATPVPLDDESLKQVFLNLMLNAMEAMPEGGRLVVSLAEERGRFRAAFSDSGPGIEPEVLKRMGHPFFTTKAKGSGLGLFLTRRLLQSAGGDLHIESLVGRGTTCVVLLPKRRG
jgi:signal transduction histidine kinase